ncbi:ATP-binding protein [Flexivirga alba]|uniref:ATP-binding protein n=1 Tax=Flexivirga alba TaxID=702742 RepID=A0ABW2AIZ4_9MICO
MSARSPAPADFYVAEPARGIRRFVRPRKPRTKNHAHAADPKSADTNETPAAQKQPPPLPAGGERGTESARSLRRFRTPAHRATSNVVAGAYPFLAEAGLGSDGVYVGQDAWSGGAFCFDPWVLYQHGVLTNPNCVLAGVVGKGKSCLAKSLATRSIALGRRVYVPGDPKGEWTAVAQAVGGASIQLGGSTSHRLNPLDAGVRDHRLSDQQWTSEVSKRRRVLIGSLAASTLGRPLLPVEHTALDMALAQATLARVPTLPIVVDAVLSPDKSMPGATVAQLARDGRDMGHALRRLVAGDLAGLFDAETSVTFDPSLPMLTLDLSRITGSDQLMAMIMTCASAWMEAALADPDAGARWVIYDEAWRLMRQPALLARMQSQWKLSRGLGIANLLVIHRLSDLDAVGDTGSEARALARGLLGDCSTKIVYQQEVSESANTATQLGLTTAERTMLPDLLTGEGLWRVGTRAFVVRHTATPDELRVFDTDQRMRA